MSQSEQAFATESEDTFWRTLQTFNATRIVIAVVLLAYLSVNTKKGFWVSEHFLYREACMAYVAAAVLFAILAAFYRQRFLTQIAAQIAVDITVISMLYMSAGGAKSGLGILYLFPLAGSAILAPLVLALFFTSIVTLVLLAESGIQLLKAADDTSISQAGLFGAAFFAAVYVISRLAGRLIKQEQLAVQHSLDLRAQEAINQLVIADMGDGILVLNQEGVILTANPAAERMVGMALTDHQAPLKLSELPLLIQISKAFSSWSSKQKNRKALDADTPTIVAVRPGDDISLQSATTAWGGRREPVTHLKLRFAKVDSPNLHRDRTVIFMQDVSEIENQAQQLKLASMGRLTASIAHEVRNPLSAISYAASLMGEEAASPAQVRLVKIVGDNVARLNRMIEDILKLSRKAQAHGEPIHLHSVMAEILEEFRQMHSLQSGVIHVLGMGRHRIHFDPLHLREVVVNLLSNALRYASGRDGSIRLQIMLEPGKRLELHVQDDGPAITPEVRAHLFEPFYTTSSKGTGLGLYVARELCLNNGAMLDYEYRADPRSAAGEPTGRFVITFALPASA